MGGTPSTPTQTTQQVLSPEQRQLMQLAMPGVQQFAAQVPQRYGGPTTAGFDPSQVAGQSMALGAGQGAVQTIADKAAGTSNFYTGGDIWNPSSNPNLQGAVDATVRPIYQNLTEKALPAIRGEAITSGNMGGSRQGVAEANAIRDTGVVAGDAASKLVQNQYDTNVRAQLQALGLIPQTQQAQLAPATTVSGVGDVRQQQTQKEIDDARAAFDFQQYAPFLQSKEIMSLLQGLPGGSTVATGSVPQSNPGLAQGLGGAAAGASLGSAIMPGVGTAAGAGIGALLPFIFR
jgi:hypothetical protein